MKAAAIAILGLFVVLPVEAGQRHRQSVPPTPSCDNDGHCTTFSAGVARIYSDQKKITRSATIKPATTAASNPEAKTSEATKTNTAVTPTVRSDPEVTTAEIMVVRPAPTGALEMTTDVVKGT